MFFEQYQQHIQQLIAAYIQVDAFYMEDHSDRHAHNLHRHDPPLPREEFTHISLRIVSPDFLEKSKVERQRFILNILKDEISGGLHSVVLRLLAPGEKIRRIRKEEI